MAVSMDAIWERSTAVLDVRGALLGRIAALTIFLPMLVQGALAAYLSPGSVAGSLIAALAALAALVAAVWGQLAILAAAADPAVDRAAAQRQANVRLPAALGVGLVLLLIATVVALPLIVALAGAGTDWSAVVAGTAAAPSMPPGRTAFVVLYGVIFGIVMLFAGARLAEVNPVVLHERLGARSIARSWRLTRGHTWRIVGVMLLFGIVLAVASGAAQAVTGIVARLILGPDALPTVDFLAAAAGAAVSTAFAVIALVFIAQLYAALAVRQPARP